MNGRGACEGLNYKHMKVIKLTLLVCVMWTGCKVYSVDNISTFSIPEKVNFGGQEAGNGDVDSAHIM